MNFELDLFSYKIYKCKINNCPRNYKCYFYHNNKDKRRSIINFKYYSRICIKKENCENIMNCIFSHNNYELLYHPNFYKTNYCMNYHQKNYCKYKNFCCNAHGEKELKIELIHYLKKNTNFFLFKFKTVFCPYKNIRHEKDKCVYSHNYQDYRRIPLNNNLNKKCNKWPKDIIPDIYNKYCNFNCKFYHGWKEFGYHYNNYKQINCKYKFKNCKYILVCPKKHESKENFIIKELKQLKNEFLTIVPKNPFSNINY